MISLQLYTLRDAFGADSLGTLERVAKIGYPGVEVAGYGSVSLDELAAKIKELGLTVTGSHVGLDALRDDFDGVIAENKKLGNTYLIVSWLDESYRGSAENWKKTAQLLEGYGQRLREAGFTLCYHNHAFELTEVFDGKTGLELLYENANPQDLKAELDVYWIQKGGGVPAETVARYANRLPLLHVKDMTPDGDFGEVGEGVLDWPAILEAGRKAGVVHYVVEQDECAGDPFDSITTSFNNLKKMGL